MRLLDQMLGSAVRAESDSPAASPSASDWWTDNHWWSGASGLGLGPDSAMRVSAVNACVNLISGVTAGFPLKVMVKLPGGGSRPAPDHPLYDILHDEPNDFQTGFEYRRMKTAHLLLRGNAISEIVPGRRGAVDQMIPIHPDRVWVERTRAGRVLYHVSSGGNPCSASAIDNWRPEARILDREEVFHLRDLSLDGLWGLSKIEQMAHGINLTTDAQAYARAYFRNGAEASIALKTEKNYTEKQQKDLIESWNAAHGGPHNAGKPTVLWGGMSVERLGLTNKDSQFLELLQYQLNDIARGFLVPPHLIGDVTKESSWGTGIEQMNIGFLQFCEMTYVNIWEAAARRDLLVNKRAFYVTHVVDGLLRGDFMSRMEGMQMAVGRPFMTVNEARNKEKMNPLPGGDELAMPLNTGTAGTALPAASRPNGKTNGKTNGEGVHPEVAA